MIDISLTFLRNCQTLFLQSSCTILHSPIVYERYSCSTSLPTVSIILILAILIDLS